MFNRLKNRQSSAQWNQARATTTERGCVISAMTPTTRDHAVHCPCCPSLTLSALWLPTVPHSLCSLCLFKCLVCPCSRQLFQGINIGIDDIDNCWPYLNGSLIDLVVVMTAFVLRRISSACLRSLYGQRQVGGEHTEREREGELAGE